MARGSTLIMLVASQTWESVIFLPICLGSRKKNDPSPNLWTPKPIQKMAGRFFPSIRNNPPIPTWRKSYSDLLVRTQDTPRLPSKTLCLWTWHGEQWKQWRVVWKCVWWRGSYRVEHYVGWSSFDLEIWEATYFFSERPAIFWVRSESRPLFSIPTIHVAWRIGQRLDFHWEWLRMHLWHLCKGGNLSSTPSKLLPVKDALNRAICN